MSDSEQTIREAIKIAGWWIEEYDPSETRNGVSEKAALAALDVLVAEARAEPQPIMAVAKVAADAQARVRELEAALTETQRRIADLEHMIDHIGYEILEGDFILRDGSKGSVYLRRVRARNEPEGNDE